MPAKPASPDFTHYPLLWLGVCFAFGIFGANYFSLRFELVLVICAAFAISAAVLIGRNFSLIFLSISFIATGFLSFQIEKNSAAENRLKEIYDGGLIESGEPVEIEGLVLGKPEPAYDGFFLKIETEQIVHRGFQQNVSGKLRLFAPVDSEQAAAEYEQLDLRYGSLIRIACNPEREDRYLNPGVLSRKKLLDQQDVDATATIKSPLLMEKLGEAQSFQPFGFVYDQRQRLISEFRNKFSVSTAGIMIASLLGDKHFLDKQTADVFREGGTFHILVISGLHITFIGGLTVIFVRLFTKSKLWQFLVTVSFLWAYTLAVGAEVPVVRASLMFTVLFFSRIVHRNGSLLNALGACALVLLIWRPKDLFSPSFQLTFVSVIAIVVMAFPLIEKLRSIGNWIPTAETPLPPSVPVWLKRFCETLYWREIRWKIEGGRQIWSASLFKSPYLKVLEVKGMQGLAAFAFEGILVSLAIQIWLLPLLVVYFHRVSIASILLNLWVGFFIALESFSALIAILLSIISDRLALPIIKLTEVLNWFLIALPRLFVDNNWAGFRLPVYSGTQSTVYFLYLIPVIFLGFAAYTWNPFATDNKKWLSSKKNHYAAVAAALLGFVIIFHPFSAQKADGRLHVDFLDVGQGDAALITFPHGETMLLDGGGRINYGNKPAGETDEAEAFEPDVPRIGEAVVSEFLWEKGFSKIDYILATHADLDHIQGLADIASNFEIQNAYFASATIMDPDFAELSRVLEKRGIPINKLRRGDLLKIGGVEVEVLHPGEGESNNAISGNNGSMVLRIRFGDKIILLTGDIEREAEQELLWSPELLKADVVKIAHHGSRTSSIQPFIDATNADYAIISVGKKSLFGHPHAEVVKRWSRAGAKVMTTGERGTISVSTNGEDLQIHTFIP